MYMHNIKLIDTLHHTISRMPAEELGHVDQTHCSAWKRTAQLNRQNRVHCRGSNGSRAQTRFA